MILVDSGIDIDQLFCSLILVLMMIYPIFAIIKQQINYGCSQNELYGSR